MIKKIFLFVLPLLTSVQLSAQAPQLKSFTHENEKFFQELNDFMMAANPDEAEALMAEFSAVWPFPPMDPKKEIKMYKVANEAFQRRIKALEIQSTFQYSNISRKFSEYQILEIYDMCDLMLLKRMKAMPDFRDYITALLGLIISDQDENSFEAWNGTLKKLMGTNRKSFGSFLTTSNNLFLYGSIYVSAPTRWTGTSKKFTFDYDSLPKVVFPEIMTLYCVAKRDTAFIYETKGVFYPTSNRFYGVGGKVNWVRAGVAEKYSYALLDKYSIRLQSSHYEADSVTYFNSKYFDYALKGKLEEKLQADVDTSNAGYPRFKSYSKRVKIENIFPSIDFDGGFFIKGAKFIGQGTSEERAKLIFKFNNVPKMEVSSENFAINDDRMVAGDAAIYIFLKDDTIFHPTLQFKYLKENNEITLYRDKKGLSLSPYYDSYHDVDIDVEWMRWKITEPEIQMSAIIGSSTHEMHLESSNYYDEEKFMALQGMGEQHPLYTVKRYVDTRNNKNNVFYFDGFSDYVHMENSDVQIMLINLATSGFVIYDVAAGKITVQPRLYHYLYAKSKKADYDNISIHSDIAEKPNATLNLLDNDMLVRGVGKVVLSASRKVFIYPSHGELVLHANRDITFGGAVKAGMMECFGKNFDFKYDDFKIDIVNADSIRIFAPHKTLDEATGQVIMERVKSTIEHVNGDIIIDKSNNKSGVRVDSFPQYPIFNSTTDSYVYFDKRNELGSVYDRSKVFFHLLPFTLDSISTLTREGIEFKGTFASGGIFPDFEETLKVMDDHSLGFTHPAPKDGVPVYGGKATYYMDINVSNRGIRGDGKLDYLTSTTFSKDFVFYVDSVNAVAQSFEIREQKEGVEYPSAKGENDRFHFEPYKDKLLASKIDKPLDMYGGQAKLNGTLIYGPEKLGGYGLVDFENAELKSGDFNFKNRIFMADTSDFKLKSAESNDGGIAFATKNVKSKIDFDKREGEFVANGGASFVDFPVNQYVCYMDQFKWFMDKFELELSTSKGEAKSAEGSAGANDLDLSGSEFISTHPKQDSLKFISPKANFDIRNYVIKAHDVKYINVADARIFPIDGEVLVERAAKMRSLDSAKIVANNLTQYHTIINAHVDISARRDYAASGDYDYEDAEGGKQKIHFANIRVDTTYQTVASGLIEETQLFKLSPQFMYKGRASIAANKKGILFEGGTKLKHDCKIDKPWIAFKSEIDPANVMIPIDTVANVYGDNRTRLLNGFNITTDSTGVYPTFLSLKKVYSDDVLITSSGFLKYDSETKEYQISNKEKLRERNFSGNYMSMNTETCKAEAEGKMQLAFKSGQVNVGFAGNILQNSPEDTAHIEGIMTLDFKLDDAMWKHMIGNIEGNPSLYAVNNNRQVYERALRDLVGKEKGDKLISDLSLYNAFKRFPDELKHNLVLSDLEFVWNKEKSSFVSEGRIGIGSMDDKQLNKYVEGYVQISRKRTGEEINIYLKIDANTWYFFTYSKGVMACLSSAEPFNAIINSLKPDKKEFKGTKDQDPYTFMLSTDRKLKLFLMKMEGE
ncbi:MAG: hypothetical protein NT150_07830 [Bacteroidetes bacterium]|nr:hypothetical protein [Bacteroidota bacterium]